MAQDHAQLRALKSYLRRRYANDLPGLRRLADETWAQATETITVTQTSFEGAATGGVISCERTALLDAIELVLSELDTTTPVAPTAAIAYVR